MTIDASLPVSWLRVVMEIISFSRRQVVEIQIRLHDGSRVLGRFNTVHTVGDLYAFVAQSTPGQSFELSTTFPRKTLSDRGVSVEAAGLAGAAVMQRLS